MRVKDHAKHGATKRAGRGWGRKETLADKPQDLKTTHLACHAWICTTFDAVISCQNWPIKYLVEQKQTLEDACVKTEIIFFRILKCMDGVNVEISMNLNNQCRLCTFVFLIRVKGRTARMKFWSLRTKPPERWILSSKMWQTLTSNIFDLRHVFVQGQISPRQNGLLCSH